MNGICEGCGLREKPTGIACGCVPVAWGTRKRLSRALKKLTEDIAERWCAICNSMVRHECFDGVWVCKCGRTE